jgi:hypothetical protein
MSMTLCPVARAVGCRKCFIVSVCPVKSIIGDYKAEPPPAQVPAPQKAPSRHANHTPSRHANHTPSGKRARSRRSRKR